jgi:hypothetical protein
LPSCEEEIGTYLKGSQSSDQKNDVRDMRVLHGIHFLEVEFEGIFFELLERLVDPKGIRMIRVSIDHCIVASRDKTTQPCGTPDRIS